MNDLDLIAFSAEFLDSVVQGPYSLDDAALLPLGRELRIRTSGLVYTYPHPVVLGEFHSVGAGLGVVVIRVPLLRQLVVIVGYLARRDLRPAQIRQQILEVLVLQGAELFFCLMTELLTGL